MKRLGTLVLSVVSLSTLLFAPTLVAQQDQVTVGTATANGTTVDVPVSIRDVSGTPLGMDRPAGSKIQSFSIKVNYSPAASVSSVTFTRAGITAGLTPASEFNPSSSGAISLLDTFQESSNPIPFTLNAGPPGDLVAHLVFTLSASAAPGTTITLTLDPSLTQLTDEGGNGATKESPGNGNLTLVDGAINIPTLTLSLSPSTQTVPVNGQTHVTATMSSPGSSITTVNATSSDPAVASVPASVDIPAGGTSMNIAVTPHALGTATITATLPSSLGGGSANATVTVVAAECTTPNMPQVAGPATAESGATYTIVWTGLTGATEYIVEESTDASFSSPTTTTVTTTSASFSHIASNVRYYYRVRARNRSGSCDTTSPPSAVISVFITGPPPPPMSVLAVVGSTLGNFGASFKTSVQLYNPRTVAVSGKIVFHAQGASAAATDPALAYSILPGKTLSYADLLPAMGTLGIGSADIVADVSSTLPIVLARVFNDAGASGTTGLAEEPMAVADALAQGSVGALLAPPDMQKFRLNVGVRTLDQGVTLAITVRDKDGLTVKSTSKTYAASYFIQLGSKILLDGYDLTGGETISFNVTAGSAFIYGATTDNVTNDPSVQFARKIE